MESTLQKPALSPKAGLLHQGRHLRVVELALRTIRAC